MVSIIMLFIFILCSFYVFYPLFKINKDNNLKIVNENRSLELNKENLIKQIEELEFEKEIGIIDEDDYAKIKNDLLLESSKYFNIKSSKITKKDD